MPTPRPAGRPWSRGAILFAALVTPACVGATVWTVLSTLAGLRAITSGAHSGGAVALAIGIALLALIGGVLLPLAAGAFLRDREAGGTQGKWYAIALALNAVPVIVGALFMMLAESRGALDWTKAAPADPSTPAARSTSNTGAPQTSHAVPGLPAPPPPPVAVAPRVVRVTGDDLLAATWPGVAAPALALLLLIVIGEGPFLIVRRSLRHHAVSTTITVLAVALGTGLSMGVFTINHQARDAFINVPTGFDAVIGGRGSQTQLVLNTIFHLDDATGKIPYRIYQEVHDTPAVYEAAVPMMLGDNYFGYRIVGTTRDMFRYAQTAGGQPVTVREGGELFDERRRSAVVGSYVAQQTGLRERSIFQPWHGLFFNPEEAPHDVDYVVSGVLEPTNTPLDRVILIPLEGMMRMPGHVTASGDEAEAGVEIPDEEKQLTAVLVRVRRYDNTPIGSTLQALNHRFNYQGNVATFAAIGHVMRDFLDAFGWIVQVLGTISWLVMIVAVASVLAGLYNTMNERRREFAILRALGASRGTVTGAILIESGAITLIGSLLGFAVLAGCMEFVAGIARHQTGVILDVTRLHPSVLLTPLAMVVLGVLAGLLPARKAYATDVATNLAPQT